MTTRAVLPDLPTLANGLATVFTGSALGLPTVLARKPNPYACSYASEIVTCQFGGRRRFELLVKYARRPKEWECGHRVGPEYEAEVYREVLQPLRVATPTLYGAHTETGTGLTWLVLEYLGDCVHANKAPSQVDALAQAARSIASFHAANDACSPDIRVAGLNRFDAAYCRRWARRALAFAAADPNPPHWLAAVCRRYEASIPELLASASTIIHGDYYTDNVLLRDTAFYTIDWERAALAPGEIDLATLTDRWPTPIVDICELEYRNARWPTGSPPEFLARLTLSRLYLHVRLLGHAPRWPDPDGRRWRYELLGAVAEELGWL